MRTELVITADGSPTLYIPEWKEHYHSVHGAVQESMHVFIRAGLQEGLRTRNAIRLLEVGLGTGFNALLTAAHLQAFPAVVDYHALEPFPPDPALLAGFNSEHLAPLGAGADMFHALHDGAWEFPLKLNAHMTLTKVRSRINNYTPSAPFDLVYYDAFAPRVQPELWTPEIFQRVYEMMAPQGILVTYCAKGDVRRAMLETGFDVERLQGPPGKREMLRATKL